MSRTDGRRRREIHWAKMQAVYGKRRDDLTYGFWTAPWTYGREVYVRREERTGDAHPEELHKRRI